MKSKETMWLLVRVENNSNFLSLPINLPISRKGLNTLLSDSKISLSDCCFYYVFGKWGEPIDAYPLSNSDVNELNWLAGVLGTLSEENFQKWNIVCGEGLWGMFWSQFRGMISVALNIDCYRYLPEIKTSADYGKWLVENNIVSFDLHINSSPDYAFIGEYYSHREEGVFSRYGYTACISEETNTDSQKGVPKEYILLGN